MTEDRLREIEAWVIGPETVPSVAQDVRELIAEVRRLQAFEPKELRRPGDVTFGFYTRPRGDPRDTVHPFVSYGEAFDAVHTMQKAVTIESPAAAARPRADTDVWRALQWVATVTEGRIHGIATAVCCGQTFDEALALHSESFRGVHSFQDKSKGAGGSE